MNESEKNWQELSDGVKEGIIYEELAQIDLKNADSVFYRNYTDLLSETTDPVDKMRVNLQMMEKVKRLRQEGKMLSIEQLRSKARTMINLDADAMRKGFIAFMVELKEPKQS